MSNDNDNRPKEMQEVQKEIMFEEPKTPKSVWRFIIPGIFLVVGLFIGFSFAMGNFTRNHGGGDFDERFATHQVNSITTDVSTVRIDVKTHNSNDIRVVFASPARGNYVRPYWELRPDGTLHIYTRSQPINFFVNVIVSAVYIYLPVDVTLDTIDLRSTTGRVEINGRITTNVLNVSVTTGRILIGDITANALDARSTTGRIELVNSNIAGNTELRTTTGRIEIESVSASTISAIATTGRIAANNVATTGNLSITTTTGRIDINNSGIGGDLTARATTGGIRLNNVDVNGKKTTTTTTGTVRMN